MPTICSAKVASSSSLYVVLHQSFPPSLSRVPLLDQVLVIWQDIVIYVHMSARIFLIREEIIGLTFHARMLSPLQLYTPCSMISG